LRIRQLHFIYSEIYVLVVAAVFQIGRLHGAGAGVLEPLAMDDEGTGLVGIESTRLDTTGVPEATEQIGHQASRYGPWGPDRWDWWGMDRPHSSLASSCPVVECFETAARCSCCCWGLHRWFEMVRARQIHHTAAVL